MKYLPLMAAFVFIPAPPAGAQMRAQIGTAKTVSSISLIVGSVRPGLGVPAYAPVLPVPGVPTAIIGAAPVLAVMCSPTPANVEVGVKIAPALPTALPSGADGAVSEKTGDAGLLDSILAGPAADVSFDGARKKPAGSFVEAKGFVAHASLARNDGRLKRNRAAGALLTASPLMPLAPTLAGMPAGHMAVVMGFGALIGALAGLLAGISVAGLADAWKKGGLKRGFTAILTGMGVIGAVAAAVGAAVGPSAFNLVMCFLAALIYIPLLGAAALHLIRRLRS